MNFILNMFQKHIQRISPTTTPMTMRKMVALLSVYASVVEPLQLSLYYFLLMKYLDRFYSPRFITLHYIHLNTRAECGTHPA